MKLLLLELSLICTTFFKYLITLKIFFNLIFTFDELFIANAWNLVKLRELYLILQFIKLLKNFNYLHNFEF